MVHLEKNFIEVELGECIFSGNAWWYDKHKFLYLLPDFSLDWLVQKITSRSFCMYL